MFSLSSEQFALSQPLFINSLSVNMDLDTTISIDYHARKIRPYNK